MELFGNEESLCVATKNPTQFQNLFKAVQK